SATGMRDNTSCYAGITGSTETPIDETNDGVFLLNRPLTDDDITDGLAHTLFVGEKLSLFEEDLGWLSGTRSSLRNVGHPINAERQRVRGPRNPNNAVGATYVGGLASDHPGGVYLLMGSGHYEFRSFSMDQKLLQQMGARADGKLPAQLRSNQALLKASETGQAGSNADADAKTAAEAGKSDQASEGEETK
ncbi:MAG: DUF1559 domain-containing protein, partial [Pirellulales bacterium]|nr:DUF1559 domain-containing protein [Pirellulales bacterium]